MREAKFAFRSCDLKSWNKISSRRQNEELETNLDPLNIQDWAIRRPLSRKEEQDLHISKLVNMKEN